MSIQFTWPEDHSQELRTMVLNGTGSYAEIAGVLNFKFGTTYSRNACISRAIRMGLPSANPRPTERKPRESSDGVVRSKPKAKINLPSINKIAELRLQCVEIVPLRLSIIDLERCQCHWPYGDGPITFCGHPAEEGASYCLPHYCLSIGLQAGPVAVPGKVLEAAE